MRIVNTEATGAWRARRVVGTGVAVLLASAGLGACDPIGPVPAEPNLTAIAIGDHHSCALAQDGTAWCWGEGAAGQLGTGERTSSVRPRAVSSGEDFVSIAAGGSHTCALTASGSAYCWGDNSMGQVDASGRGSVAAPTPVAEGFAFTSLSAGWEHTCGITADGLAVCWGRGSEGQLGTGETPPRGEPAPVAAGFPLAFISAGGRHTCAGGADGVLYCWGANELAQLGIGEAGSAVALPAPVDSPLRFTQVSAGFGHSCAIAADATLRCWGENAYGEIGNTTVYEPGLPAEVRPVPTFYGVTYQSLSAGRSYTCAVRQQGEAMCWGLGSSGQLGNASLGNQVVGQLVRPAPGARFTPNQGPYTKVAAGGTAHTCGLTSAGTVLCWGRGASGQLGYPAWLSMIPQPVRFAQ